VRAVGSWLVSLVWELIRPRPHGASVLSECVSVTKRSEHWGHILSGSSLGINESILLDGRDVGVGPQNLQVSVGEGSSETVDDVPFVCDLGLGADRTGNGRDTSRVCNVVLEGHDVMSSNRIFSLLDGDEGGWSSEDLENTEDESDELLGEHAGRLELWNLGLNEWAGAPFSKCASYLSHFNHLVTL